MTVPAAVPLFAVIAVGRNGVIGRDGGLPWTMPSDLAHFRALTTGCPMLMGRRTFQAIGRALPGRDSIVVSRSWTGAATPGVFNAASADEGVALARRRAEAAGAPGVAVIGGAILLAALQSALSRIELTIVDLFPVGDTSWPMPDPFVWREIGRFCPPRDPRDDAACVFLTFDRAPGAPSPSIEGGGSLR